MLLASGMTAVVCSATMAAPQKAGSWFFGDVYVRGRDGCS